MSGFALIFNRQPNNPVETELIDRLVHRLGGTKTDGQSAASAGNFALGFRYFWTTPEDQDSIQPLTDPSGRYGIVFDGRLDNRDEVLSALGADRNLSDAEVVLTAYVRWGDDAFAKLIGPMAAAITDNVEQCVILARDALGCRSLVYYLDSRVLVAATEPFAVLGYPAVSQDLNDDALARWCAVAAPRMGTTFFKAVKELGPAQVMRIEMGRDSTRRFWDASALPRLTYRNSGEYAEHFRQVLSDSVRACLRTVGPAAVSLSGGYDSTGVAGLAAREIAKRGDRLHSISWLFDDLPEADERTLIELMNRRFDMQATMISGDDCWPLQRWQDWPHNPNTPDPNPYRLLVRRVQETASGAGARVVLTGAFGNELFSGTEYWLAELIRDGKIGEAARGLNRHLRRYGPSHAMTRASIVQAIGWLLDVIPGGRVIRPRRRGSPPAWLTAQAREALSDGWTEAEGSARPAQYRAMFGTYTVTGLIAERQSAAEAGIDLRHPFHNQWLAEFCLSAPAYVAYNGGTKKQVLADAVAGIVPEKVRAAQSTGLLGGLYRRGMLDKERESLEKILNRPDAVWRRYVQPEAMTQALKRLKTADQGADLLVPWRCASLEMWLMKSNSAAAA